MSQIFKYSPLAAAVLMALNTSAVADSKSKTFALDKVVVAATRTEEKRENVASAVGVIDADNIENNLSGNIRDLMRYEPGVSVGGNTGDAARFGTKGFNIRGLDENRVKITVDGISQANSFTPTGNPFQRAGRNQVDIDSIKRVEVVKGPASTLYGSDALGGLVAYTTKDPADYLAAGDNTGGNIKLLSGSADSSFSQTLTLANRTGKLESLLVYTNRDTEELENHDDSENQKDPQEADVSNVLAKVQYQVNESHRIGLTLESLQEDTFTEMPSKLDSSSYSDFYYGDDTKERQRVTLFHQWQAANTLFDQLHWQLDWQETEEDQETHTVYSSRRSPVARYRIKDYAQTEELTRFSAQLDKNLNNHQLTYGLEFKSIDLTNAQDTLYPTDPDSSTLDRAVPLVESTSYGFYLQDQITLMDGTLLLTPGIRYDNFEAEPTIDNNFEPPTVVAGALADHDSDKVTLRLGAVYKITEFTSVFAQYSQGFKTPDLLDLYYASERNYGPGFHYLTLPNPALKPEESDSYEIGVRLKGEAGNLEVVAFYNDYKNFIESSSTDPEYNGTTFDRVTQSENIASATIKGLEARGALWLDQQAGAPEGTALQFSLAYADGEDDETSTPLESINPLKAVIGLTYDNPNNTWGGTLNWTLVESKDESDLADSEDFATPGYGTLDLNAYYNINKNLTLRASIDNLTDKAYWEYEDMRGKVATATDLDRYTLPGRNFTASVVYKF